MIFEGRDPQLFESVAFELGAVLDSGERGAAPERKRLLECGERLFVAPCGSVLSGECDEPVELGRIETVDHQPVAAADSFDLEAGPAEPGDVDLQRLCCAGRSVLAPDRVDEPLVGDGRAARDEQRDEKCARLGPAAKRLTSNLERSEYPEVHDPFSLEPVLSAS